MFPDTTDDSERPLERLAFEIARNQVGPKYPADQLATDMGLTENEFLRLLGDPLFCRMVRNYAKELTEKGASFQMKAQIQAEELLKTNFKIARNPDTPPLVAVKAIENTVRWAGLEKKAIDNSSDPDGGKGKIQINISLGGAGPDTSVTIDAPATTPTPELDTQAAAVTIDQDAAITNEELARLLPDAFPAQ